jgi:hypothetical protein
VDKGSSIPFFLAGNPSTEGIFGILFYADRIIIYKGKTRIVKCAFLDN